MKSKPEKTIRGPVSCAAAMPNLPLGIRPLLNGLGFRDELGKRRAQRLGQCLGNVQAGIAQGSFQHSNVGWMQIGPFSQRLLGQCLSFPVPPEHQGEGIRHFQTPHFFRMQRRQENEHRQLY